MQVWALFRVILLIRAVLAVASTGSKGLNQHIREFGDSAIEDNLKRARYSLIYFYRDACQYCDKFNPDFENLSVLFNNASDSGEGENSIIQVIKTNGKVNPRLNQLFKVQSYPTLKLLDFKTMEIFTYTKRKRDILSLLEFVKEKVPDAKPNYKNFVSKVKYLDNASFDDHVKQSKKDTLVVFTMPYMDDWINYQYPAHFYQQLADRMSSDERNIQFSLVDAGSQAASDVIAGLKISNFPSIVYFKGDGRVKAYGVYDQNQVMHGILSEKTLDSFIDNIDSEEHGKWFESVEKMVESREESTEYDGNLHYKPGFNVRQDNRNGEDEEEQYRQLLREVEL
ncbi:hypothetical protein G9P44_001933 [Scheffersomyces stipitis]|nr:hypothetical protein G9P44_001933 [Scheffersomyces stipitis]